MLKDLNQLALDAKKRRDEYDNKELKLSGEFKSAYKATFPNSKIIFQEYTCVDFTPKNLSIVIPNQWFIIGSFFTEYLEALLEYKAHVMEFGFSRDDIESFKNDKILSDKANLEISKRLSGEEAERFVLFLTDYDWWFGAKSIDRGDFVVSSILNLASVVHVAQGHISKLTHDLFNNKVLVDLLYKSLEDTESKEHNDLKSRFATWLINNPNNNYFDNDFDRTVKMLSKYQEKYESEFRVKLFEVDIHELDKEIQIINKNIWNDESEFWLYSKNHATHQPRAILGTENYLQFLRDYSTSVEEDKHFQSGYNKIYFGAPGTGKSYAVAQLLKEREVPENRIERVTFHPDYDYSSFVGGYKPVTESNENNEQEIHYKFVPQVFTNIYVKAHQQPDKNFYLIIEEINRGNCAEIFGDVFQLLDRNPDYMISPSEDLKKHLTAKDKNSKYKALINGKMSLPNNLIVLATMNTSDQSLYPMDSAFKRRWNWEYVPIHFPQDKQDRSCPSYNFQISIDSKTSLSWIDFVAKINSHIVRNPSLGMDKCLGNFFIKPAYANKISLDDFIHKVMFYLWNDVFKDEDNEIFQEQTYLDYFPIKTNGANRLLELVEKLELRDSVVKMPETAENEIDDESYQIESTEESS